MTIDTSPDALERLALAEILLAPHDETVLYVLSVRKTLLAIAAEKRAQGWQPIETAPKVELAELILCNGKIVCAGSWWEGSWSTLHDYIDPQPTHWMPLPKPPGGV